MMFWTSATASAVLRANAALGVLALPRLAALAATAAGASTCATGPSTPPATLNSGWRAADVVLVLRSRRGSSVSIGWLLLIFPEPLVRWGRAKRIYPLPA